MNLRLKSALFGLLATTAVAHADTTKDLIPGAETATGGAVSTFHTWLNLIKGNQYTVTIAYDFYGAGSSFTLKENGDQPLGDSYVSTSSGGDGSAHQTSTVTYKTESSGLTDFLLTLTSGSFTNRQHQLVHYDTTVTSAQITGTFAVPGPIAGSGLPALLALGGLLAYRRKSSSAV